MPCVYFTPSEQNIRCQVAVSNALSVKTSELLAVYAKLDPRVIGLVVLFKYWAKVKFFLYRILHEMEFTLRWTVLFNVNFKLLLWQMNYYNYI